MIASFYKQQSSKSEVLEVPAISGVMPGGLNHALVGKEGRGPSGYCGPRIPWVTPGETVPLLESPFGRGGMAYLETKELVGTIELPCSLA